MIYQVAKKIAVSLTTNWRLEWRNRILLDNSKPVHLLSPNHMAIPAQVHINRVQTNREATMKKQFTIITLGALLLVNLWAVNSATAGTSIEGTVQGLNCVVYGKACAVDKMDPHVDGENTFVVVASDKKYYFLRNIDRSVMARLVNERVRVMGEQNNKYNAMKAKTIEVKTTGNYTVYWSQAMHDRAMWRYQNRFGGVPGLITD